MLYDLENKNRNQSRNPNFRRSVQKILPEKYE